MKYEKKLQITRDLLVKHIGAYPTISKMAQVKTTVLVNYANDRTKHPQEAELDKVYKAVNFFDRGQPLLKKYKDYINSYS